jgi:allophanate hydrolase
VSVFALTVPDATLVAQLMAAYDARDPYSRPDADQFDPRPRTMPSELRVAIPAGASLVIHEAAARAVFEQVLAALAALGCKRSQLSLDAFNETAQLLYQGPFVAERLEASGALLARDPDAIQPVVRGILESARKHSALDAYVAQAQLSQLRRACEAAMRNCDVLLVPSTSLFPRVADVLTDPIGINSELGRYTNFVNLLDLCALAVPAGIRADGLPFGVTLIARAGQDALLASLGQELHARLGTSIGMGATSAPLPPLELGTLRPAHTEHARLAVVGAHLSGQPLNHELTELGARFVTATQTSASYRLYALPTQPPKPGLVRVAPDQPGRGIELEVWELTFEAFGRFVARIPAPLGIGSIELASGERVQGFVCESAAVSGSDARDITQFGGWRGYLTNTRS